MYYSQLRLIAINLVVIFCALFVSGCSIQHKEYDYKDSTKKYAYGEIFVRLIGDWNKTERKELILGPPYELFIAVTPTESKNGTVDIKNIRIYSEEKRKIVYQINDKISEPITYARELKSYDAYFTIKGLDIEYDTYKVMFDISIVSDEKTIKDKASLDIAKDYREFKRNIFREMIRSY